MIMGMIEHDGIDHYQEANLLHYAIGTVFPNQCCIAPYVVDSSTLCRS